MLDVRDIRTSYGATHQAQTVVLAMGSAYRKLGVPGEQYLTGHGVSWCATCDGFFVKGQNIAVVGGGDSALEEAMFLTRFAASVTVIHRRDFLRASKIMQDHALADPKIRLLWNTEVTEALGADELTGLRLRDTVIGEESELAVTGLFIAIGHDPRSELILGQVDVDADNYVLVDSPTTITNLPGVFAAGDLVNHRYRQAIMAAGTGCAAAAGAEHYLATHGLAS